MKRAIIFTLALTLSPLFVISPRRPHRRVFAQANQNNFNTGAFTTITSQIGYFGNAGGDNGTDSITGILVNGSTIQSARDQVDVSVTGIWAPDSTTPPHPNHVGVDTFTACSLGSQNTVLSTTITGCGSFSANPVITANVGQTVSVADLFSYVSNVPFIGGAGTTSATRSSGYWATNVGSSHVPNSYAFRCDQQSGSTVQAYCYWQQGSSPNLFNGNTAVGAHLKQVATGNYAGTCVFAASTTCSITYGTSFTSTPVVMLTPVNPGATTFTLTATSNAGFTVTASGSNSLTVNWQAIGNPN